jgi:hypothetical protein
MNVELLAGVEAIRLLKRDPVKYARGVGGMYLLSVKGIELGQIARASFFFFRNQDDSLDGDRADIRDPLSHVLSCREQIESGVYTGKPPIVDLAKFAIKRLNQRSNGGDDPKQNFLDEIDVMLFDHERSKEKRILTKGELEEYYRKTFFPVVNIMLIGLNSRLRAVDIPELSFCQGRVYSVRDLDTDWRRGVINIPREVLEQANLSTDAPIGVVRHSSAVKDWICRQLHQVVEELPNFELKLAEANEGLTNLLCRGLTSPLYRLSEKYLKELG